MAGRLVLVAGVAIVIVTLVAALYGALRYGRPTDVSIDLTSSLDHRVVYPMDRETVIVPNPGRIDLRLPNGRAYHQEHAHEVWISRTEEGDRNLIRQVSITTLFDTPEEAYARAHQFQEEWGMGRGTVLDDWRERRELAPHEPGVHPIVGEHRVTGVYVNGRPFSVGFELRTSAQPGERFQLIEELNWGDR